MIQSFYYPFTDFNPDVSTVGNDGIGMLWNMQPIKGKYYPSHYLNKLRQVSYGPSPSFTNISGDVIGLWTRDDATYLAVADGTTGYKLYISDIVAYRFSDVDHEYDVTPAAATWIGTGTTDPPYYLQRLWGVQFANYGNYTYACNGVDSLHRINHSDWTGAPSSTKFIKYTPTTGSANIAATILRTHQGSLFAFGITFKADWNGYSSGALDLTMMWWSAFDDPNAFGSYTFTPQFKGTDFRILYETPGSITGACSAGDLMYVFKAGSIYLVEGPPFRVQLLVDGVGTNFPNSVTFYEGWVYFWSAGGPARINSQGQLEYLIDNKISRTKLGNSDHTSNADTIMYGFHELAGSDLSFCYKTTQPADLTSAVDPTLKIVTWLIPTDIRNFYPPNTYKPHMIMYTYDTTSGKVGIINPIPESLTGGNTDPVSSYNACRIVGYNNTYYDVHTSFFMIAPTSSSIGRNSTKNWHAFYPQRLFSVPDSMGESAVFTKFFRPPTRDASMVTRIVAIRPVYKVARYSDNLNMKAYIWSINKYIEDENSILATPTDSTTNILTNGKLIFDNTPYAREHCIKFTIDTVNGVSTTSYSKYVLSGVLDGIEIFYESQLGDEAF